MDDLGRPHGRYLEIFMLISLLEVCQEIGVLDQIFGGQGHPLCHGGCFFYPKDDTLKV